ncbi:MAG TPA: hypothetical protein PKJ77_02810 [Thermodesulfobacteriota bacterium]|nr:hypothetical protein [Deltaproteobacteria bacterium]HNR13013.1 hypothetical protein [Thermodesulfobacteriota bacterium]HNU70627.1 hypothetical protein [Thermodesulfobacteriota bacterium]HOC38189.1 hypothetical protein [Thermodesulfobacteriota bacterium]
MMVPRMNKNDLRSHLGDADTIVIDVRRHKDESRITGAHLENPDDVRTWMDTYPRQKTLVLYCA